jgi:predicted nucleotidyltransferase component of viral defense system
MNPALAAMLEKHALGSVDEQVNALREVLQELTLLGLWRGKFFEQAAFYGGTALRILHGLDRYSEDMDFSLLAQDLSFSLQPYLPYVVRELESWGFHVTATVKQKSAEAAVESAFLKANTREQLLVIEAPAALAEAVHPGQKLSIKLEVDRDPPGQFSTEAQFCLQPIPFSVRAYAPSSLFAGKMHAVLCRGWGTRVKGRDWYDFVWYVGRQTPLDLVHLEARMRQSGHFEGSEPLTEEALRSRLADRIDELDVSAARADVVRFLRDDAAVAVWSKAFFHAVAGRMQIR